MIVRGIRIDKGGSKWYSGREKNVVFFLLVPFSLDGVQGTLKKGSENAELEGGGGRREMRKQGSWCVPQGKIGVYLFKEGNDEEKMDCVTCFDPGGGFCPAGRGRNQVLRHGQGHADLLQQLRFQRQRGRFYRLERRRVRFRGEHPRRAAPGLGSLRRKVEDQHDRRNRRDLRQEQRRPLFLS